MAHNGSRSPGKYTSPRPSTHGTGGWPPTGVEEKSQILSGHRRRPDRCSRYGATLRQNGWDRSATSTRSARISTTAGHPTHWRTGHTGKCHHGPASHTGIAGMGHRHRLLQWTWGERSDRQRRMAPTSRTNASERSSGHFHRRPYRNRQGRQLPGRTPYPGGCLLQRKRDLDGQLNAQGIWKKYYSLDLQFGHSKLLSHSGRSHAQTERLYPHAPTRMGPGVGNGR